MDTIVGDGASKNRSAFKLLSTVSARKILGNHYTEHQLRDLPLDFKIGFPHPHPQCWKHGIIIVIGGEMPHWGKKFRNAFDNKSRDLLFRGKLMNLPMIAKIWETSGDADSSVGLVRRYTFTQDHFNLNAYLKTRVFLAFQIPSQTTIGMIKDHCDAKQYP